MCGTGDNRSALHQMKDKKIAASPLPYPLSDTRVLRQLYEWGEHQFLKPRFKFDSILDAGANIGLASVLFANM